MTSDIIGIAALIVLMMNAAVLWVHILRQNERKNEFRKQEEICAMKLAVMNERIAALRTETARQEKRMEEMWRIEAEMAKMAAQIDELRHDVRDLKQMKG